MCDYGASDRGTDDARDSGDGVGDPHQDTGILKQVTTYEMCNETCHNRIYICNKTGQVMLGHLIVVQ